MDEIETEGAEMQTTKYGKIEIVFSVTGRDIKCADHKLSMIGPPRHHGQYISWTPRGLFREQVLDYYSVDGYGERYQTKERVRFQEPLKYIFACSWMVYSRELEKAEPTLSCARVPDSTGSLEAGCQQHRRACRRPVCISKLLREYQ